MFGSRWQVIRLLGIPIYVDLSWLLILALITWSLSVTFRQQVPSLGEGAAWGLGLICSVAFFTCILLHELGHSVVARSNGMPIRGITLFLFGGVSEMEGEPPSAGKEFFMAIAGPAVSAVLAVLFYILGLVGEQTNWSPEWIAAVQYLAYVNTAVVVFNLIPAFPMDGGRVLRSALWAFTGNLRRSTYWAVVLGRCFAYLLIALGLLCLFSGNWLAGIWLGVIGLFLNNAATGSYQQLLIKQALQGEPVERFMNPNPIAVSPDLDLRHWVEEYVYRYHRKLFPVVNNGHLEGVITTRALEQYPREDWAQHTVKEAMRHELRPVCIAPHSDALHALQRMQRTGFSRLLVTDGDRLLGIISLKDLLAFLHMKLNLEPEHE